MFRLRQAAPLARVAVPLSRGVCLGIPTRAVVGFKPAAPRRVLVASHAGAMRDIETLTAAITRLGCGDSTELCIERLAAYRASQAPSFVVPNEIVGALPCTAALPIAEVVILDRAGGYPFFLAAPVTSNHARFVPALRAKMLARSFGPPRRPIEVNPTSRALNNHMTIISVAARLCKKRKRDDRALVSTPRPAPPPCCRA